MKKSFLALTLTATMLLSGSGTVYSENSATVYFKEDFSCHYNADSLHVTKNLKYSNNLLEIRTENQNKYLYFERNSGDPHIDFYIANKENKFVVQADFKLSQINAGAITFGITASGYSINISDYGKITASDGTYLGWLNTSSYTNIALAIDPVNKLYDVYINGSKKTNGISVESNDLSTSTCRIYIYNNAGVSSIKFDNLLIYSGNSLIDIDNYGGFSKKALADDNAALNQVGNAIAVHAMSERAIINGERVEISARPKFIDNVLWIPYDVIEKAGKTVSCATKNINGINFVKLSEVAKALNLNYYIDSSGYGFDKGFAIMGSGDYSQFASNFMLYNEANNYLCYERPKATEIKAKVTTSHPRLLATAEDFKELKSEITTDAKKAEWYADLIAFANKRLTYGVPSTELDGSRLNSLHGLIEPTINMCLAYRLSGNEEYAKKVYTDLEVLGKREDWNPAHFLDIGAGTVAYAIAYDWLYDYWNDTQKKFLEETIYTHSLIYVHNSLYNGRYTSWIEDTVSEGNTGNWPIVCMSGPVMGALALMEVYPEISAEIVQDGFRVIEYTLKGFADTGDWTEGPLYWTYANRFLSYLLGSCDTAMGTDFGYYHNTPGITDTVYYAYSLATPNGVYNFGDAEYTNLNLFPASWHASKIAETDSAKANEIYKLILQYNNKRGLNGDLWDFLKMDTSAANSAPESLNSEYISEKLGFSSLKSGDDIYFGYLYGPKLRLSHDHYDHGSFVYETKGARWALDLGRDNYDMENYNTAAYRRRAEGHNVYVINPDEGPGQIKDTYKTYLVNRKNDEKGYRSVADLTASYSDWATKARRGYKLDKALKTLTVRDEISFKQNSDFYWFMHTEATVQIEGNKALLVSPDNSSNMLVEFISNQPLTISASDAVPFAASPEVTGDIKNNPNNGIKKIVISGSVSGDLTLTVKLTPMDGNTYPEIADESLENWFKESEEDEEIIVPEKNILADIKVNGISVPEFDSAKENYTIGADYTFGTPFVEAIPGEDAEVTVTEVDKYNFRITVSGKVYNIHFTEVSGEYNRSLVKNGIAMGSAYIFNKNENGDFVYTDSPATGKNFGGMFVKNVSEKNRKVYLFASYTANGREAIKVSKCELAPGQQKFLKVYFEMNDDISNYDSLVFRVIDTD
ncbi:MAG: heparinase II/III family protein [Clostridia bacterium]|nr:heparinase II/III family protein [Clostridia bacterium]